MKKVNYHLTVNELRNVNGEIIKHNGYTFFEDDCKKQFKINLKKHHQKLNINDEKLELICNYINKNENTIIGGFSYNIIQKKYETKFVSGVECLLEI